MLAAKTNTLSTMGPRQLLHTPTSMESSHMRDDLIAVLIDVARDVEGRNPWMIGHCWRVSMYAGHLARAMGWSESRIGDFQLGARLHHLAIIQTYDTLSNPLFHVAENETVPRVTYPLSGLDLVCNKVLSVPVLACIRSYREHWDGNGVPYGLRGPAIPVEGRMLAVLDTFDTLTSADPHHPAKPAPQAIAELERRSGSQFSPEIVDFFVTLYQTGVCESIALHNAPGRPLLACPTCGPIIPRPDVPRTGGRIVCPGCGASLKVVTEEGELSLMALEAAAVV